MKRRAFLQTTAGLATSAVLSPALAAARRPRPNIVLVLCDDLGYGDIGCMGGRIPTPAIDRIARGGTLFTDFYAAANLCTPSRAGLLTGRYAVRTGLGYQVILQNDERGLAPTEPTIASVLGAVGYACGLFGKWHLGHRGPAWPPTRHGFDRFVGIPYSHDMTPLNLFTIDRDGETREEPAVLTDLQQRFYGAAEHFIEANATRPFFVELALSAPHLPAHPSAAWQGKSPVGSYGDTVMEIDALMGRLTATLRRLGVERDTLVLFTSDNGPWYEGSAGSLRARKGGGGYDGGYRAPLIAYRPGAVPAGRRCGALAMATDFLPTFCAMAGAPAPDVPLDGLDISRLIEGRTDITPHDELVLFDNEDPVAIRTQRWSYVSSDYYRGRLFDTERRYPQLYDMRADPGQTYSLADRHPDVLADMQRRLADARRRFAPYKSREIPAAFQRSGAS